MTAGKFTVLDTSVLVLNKMFMAVHVVNVRRAFCLLCKDLAEVISCEEGLYSSYDFSSWQELSELRLRVGKEVDDDWIRTPGTEIQAPRVIRLLEYDKVPRQTVKFNRRNIFARDNNQCQYCGAQVPDVGTQSGPRRPPEPERADVVGQYCLRLRRLQRAEGRADAASGEHDTNPQAGEAEAEPGRELETVAEEVSLVANVPRHGLLVGRTQVTKAVGVAPTAFCDYSPC